LALEVRAVPEDLTLEASAPVQVVSVRADLEEALKTLALEQRGTLVPVVTRVPDQGVIRGLVPAVTRVSDQGVIRGLVPAVTRVSDQGVIRGLVPVVTRVSDPAVMMDLAPVVKREALDPGGMMVV